MDRVIYKPKRDFISTGERVKNSTLGSFFGNSFVKLGFLAVSIFLSYSIYNAVVITSQKIDISKQARKEVNNLRLENLQLAISLEAMHSEEYIEVQARDKLNFSGSNEYIFVIPESTLKSAQERITAYFEETEENSDTPSSQLWFDFLKNGI